MNEGWVYLVTPMDLGVNSTRKISRWPHGLIEEGVGCRRPSEAPNCPSEFGLSFCSPDRCALKPAVPRCRFGAEGAFDIAERSVLR